MKISLNWLKRYVKIPQKVSDDDLIRLIGARLVEVEGVIDETSKYDKIYVAKVESCEKIPDTHLSLCQIKANKPELVQVVCGAPNVRAGMLAVWIAPGATVPASVHEDAPFVIGTRKMRGYESNGMLAGADELDFGDDHSGIVELAPDSAQPGDSLADVFDLRDLVLEIENKSLTHRPDCFGIIGFAREVAGILGLKFDEPEFLTQESVFPAGFLVETKHGLTSKDNKIKIRIEEDEICARYTVAQVKVTDALQKEKYLSEMQIWLAKSGMSSVSKIVDVTNYLMLLTGQPLHAFDLDKFLAVGKSETPEIIVRRAREGEELELLDEKVVQCNTNDILITSNDVPVALAGAMGGKNTEIDDSTKNILLESATFSLYNLRKTQMAHGIFTEAITRFTKGVPAGGTFNVLAEAIREIGGKPVALNDEFAGRKASDSIKVTTGQINGLLGTNYGTDLIMATLTNVGIDVKKLRQAGERDVELEVTAPVWRTDIHIREDVIEEVGRLLGYDNIEPTLPNHATANKNAMLNFKKMIRDVMARYGANEVLTYSFVSENLLKKAKQETMNSYKIVNSISPDLQYVRQSLVPSLLSKAYINEKMPVDKFAMFEMNKIYRCEWGMNEEGVPVEQMSLGFVVAERKNNETAFYKAKLYAVELLKKFNIVAEFRPTKSKAAEMGPFEPKRTADILINGEYVGIVGEFKKSVRHDFKLAEYLAGFELNLDLLMKNVNVERKIDFREKKKEDLTVTTDKSYAEVLAEIEKKHPEAVITPGVIYQGEGQSTKNITFHLEY